MTMKLGLGCVVIKMTQISAFIVGYTVFLSFGFVLGNYLIPLKKYDVESELRQTLKRTAEMIPSIVSSILTKRNEELYKNGTQSEDVHMSIDKLITKNGHKVEKHKVTTDDGYIIKFFRIPSAGPPVFLMHGLLLSSDDWVTSGPQSGLAYLLAAEGYDVWIGNARGVPHARKHVKMSNKSPLFWDFSWAEIGYYDIPAMVDYVLQATGASQLFYVCHSQGCTTFFVMMSEKPEYNDKVRLMVGLAPATAVRNIKSPLILFIRYVSLLHPEIIFALLKYIGLYEFVPRYELVDGLINNLCGDVELARKICSNLAFILCGFSPEQLNMTTLPVVFNHAPTVSSVKQLEHYAQTLTTGRFQKFDYGAKKNLEVYGAATPPEYKLGSIRTPVAIFYSDNDWLVPPVDALKTSRRLRNVVDVYRVPDDQFNHLDFLFAKDMRTLVLPRLLKLIREYT